MQVLLYDESGQITEQLTELIEGNNDVRVFHKASSAADVLSILAADKPGILIMHLQFANRNAATLLKNIRHISTGTAVILLVDVLEEHNETLFNIHKEVYILETYADFEKIPGMIGDIKRKTKRTDST